MKRITWAILGLALVLAGCDLAKSSRDGIASAKGALDKAKLEYSCGTATQNQSLCAKLTQATAVKDVAIDALTIYCSGPQWDAGGACQPSTDPDKKKVAADKLNAAIKNLNQIMADLKPFLKGGK